MASLPPFFMAEKNFHRQAGNTLLSLNHNDMWILTPKLKMKHLYELTDRMTDAVQRSIYYELKPLLAERDPDNPAVYRYSYEELATKIPVVTLYVAKGVLRNSNGFSCVALRCDGHEGNLQDHLIDMKLGCIVVESVVLRGMGMRITLSPSVQTVMDYAGNVRC